MRQRYVVIGLGVFGGAVARRLAEKGSDVLGIDLDERIVDLHKDHIGRAVVADATDRDTLQALGIREFTTAIVGIGEQRESNILVTALLRELGVKRILTRATSSLHARILQALGVRRILRPEEEIGVQVADTLISTLGLVRYPLSLGVLIAEVPVHPSMEGESLADLRLAERFGVNVVAVETPKPPEEEEGKGKEPGEEDEGEPLVDLRIPPDPSAPLEAGQVLVLLGDEKAMGALADAYGT